MRLKGQKSTFVKNQHFLYFIPIPAKIWGVPFGVAP